MDDQKPNIPLKAELMRRRMSQRELAKKTNILESVLSMAITGKYILDSNSKMKIALVLGINESELFSNV